MILFGVRSPLTVDFEESLHRLGLELSAGVSVSGVPRLLDRSKLVAIADFDAPQGAPFIACAFSAQRRGELISQAQGLGLTLADAIIDPTAILPRSLRVGAGSFINAGVVIGAMSFIGEAALINRAVSLGHHTVIGDYATIGPGATLAGNINVGEAAVIGAGAIIHPHVRIGAGAIISAGTVVRKDVADATLVAGNPAKAKSFIPRRSTLNTEGEE